MKQIRVCITGAGGFIGHYLVAYLKELNYWVRGVDVKCPEFGKTNADEFKLLDLRETDAALKATKDIDEVYALAADMGGMGFIFGNQACILHNNLLINLNTLEATRRHGIQRYFFSSSACIYPTHLQGNANVVPLKEEDAYPANPQGAYGWEKLTTEQLCGHYRKDYGIEVHVARFHNIYGPLTAWKGGREKAPAALCRKVAIAKLTGSPEVEIWGDGQQTRSFCYISDAIRGIHLLMRSSYVEPLNIGSDRLITIDQMVDIIADIAGIKVVKVYISGPQGVRGRNSDNSRVQKVLRWQPQVALEEGLACTYYWVEEQVAAALKADPDSIRAMSRSKL